MALNPAFSARLREAKRLYARQRDPQPVYDREIGELVGEALDRAPFTAQAVNRWLKGAAPDDVHVIAALAMVLGVSPAWLAWGGSNDPAPSTKADELATGIAVRHYPGESKPRVYRKADDPRMAGRKERLADVRPRLGWMGTPDRLDETG